MASTGTVGKESPSAPRASVEDIKTLPGTLPVHHEVHKNVAESHGTDATRFPKDVDGASHGPVWQDIAAPLTKDPANQPGSEEWDQTKQMFKDTGLLKRM